MFKRGGSKQRAVFQSAAVFLLAAISAGAATSENAGGGDRQRQSDLKQGGEEEKSPCSFADAALHAFRKEEGRMIGRSWRELKTKTAPAREGFYILDRQGRFIEISILNRCKKTYQAKVTIESPFAERKLTCKNSGKAAGRALQHYDPKKEKREKGLTFDMEGRKDYHLFKIKRAGGIAPVKLYVSRWSCRVAESADLMNDASFHFGCSPDAGFIPQIAKEGGRTILSVRQKQKKGERIYDVRFSKEQGEGGGGLTTAPAASTEAAGAQTRNSGGRGREKASVQISVTIPQQNCLIERWMRWGPRALN